MPACHTRGEVEPIGTVPNAGAASSAKHSSTISTADDCGNPLGYRPDETTICDCKPPEYPPTFGDERAIGARLHPATDKMLIAPEATA